MTDIFIVNQTVNTIEDRHFTDRKMDTDMGDSESQESRPDQSVPGLTLNPDSDDLLTLENKYNTESTVLPWDRFSSWIHCICIVTFDLEVGQAIEVSFLFHNGKHTLLMATWLLLVTLAGEIFTLHSILLINPVW